MLLYPAVQQTAQEEIDRVVGGGRLPKFEDRSSLLYIEAVYRELLRWAPPFPLNIPHAPTDDFIFKGYHIPKGRLWCFVQNPCPCLPF